MAGKLLNLHTLFGHFRPSPRNRTEQERDAKGAGLGASALDSLSWYHQNMQRSVDFKQHVAELNEMSEFEFIQPIIDLYAEESTQPDVEKNKTVWYECNDAEIEKDLNSMLERIGAEDKIYSINFNVAALGNDFQRILRNDEYGIVSIASVDPKKMERVWEPTTKRLIGYRWDGQTPAEDDATAFVNNEKIFAPWEFVHFRRLGRNTGTEYGTALVDHLFPIYRKLKMALDQMLIYRLHTMPNRFAVYVDTGTQAVSEAMETVNMFRNHFRSSLAITKEGQFDARHNPMALDSVLFMPLPKDSQTKIDTLKGNSDVPDVVDLKLLFNMLFGAARIPKAYLGFEEDEGGLSNSSLVTKDMRFARTIRALRRPIVTGFHRLAQLQIAFKGKDPAKYKVKVHMSKICAIEEELKASMMEKQANMAGMIIDICQRLTIPNKDIVELVFREILHLPQNFVNIAKLAMSVQQAFGTPGDQGGGGGGGGMGMGMGGGMGGGLPGALGIEDPDAQGPGASPFNPNAASNPNMPTAPNSTPPPSQLSSVDPENDTRVLAEASRLFVNGLRQTLTESTDPDKLAAFKESSWELKSLLTDFYRTRSTMKTSCVEVESQRSLAPTLDEPVYDRKLAGKNTNVTEAASHPAVAIVRRTRQITNGDK